jgi:hypothetical protein
MTKLDNLESGEMANMARDIRLMQSQLGDKEDQLRRVMELMAA